MQSRENEYTLQSGGQRRTDPPQRVPALSVPAACPALSVPTASPSPLGPRSQHSPAGGGVGGRELGGTPTALPAARALADEESRGRVPRASGDRRQVAGFRTGQCTACKCSSHSRTSPAQPSPARPGPARLGSTCDAGLMAYADVDRPERACESLAVNAMSK